MQTPGTAAYAGTPFKVLVIDDEACMRDSCAQVLQKQGLSVEVAPDGETGLQLASSLKPDVTILDLKMPGIQGQEVLLRMRQFHPDGVVIVVTGFPTLETAVEAIKAGAYDFIPKPFTPPELRTIVHRALEKRALQKRAAELEQEMRRIHANLEKMLSHQMKSPLAAIAQYAMLLQAGDAASLDEKQRAWIGRIQARAGYLLRLVDNFLKLSRLEAQGGVEGACAVDLPAVARSAWEDAGSDLCGKRVEFRVKAPPDAACACVKGDEFLLHEVFLNLFTNGLKFTPDGGSIEVEILPPEGAFAVVAVSDTGRGIRPEELPFLFQEFFRGSAGKAGPGSVPGTGLGLSIVKRVVAAHRGTIAAESEPGRGTTFKIRLPLSAPGPSAAAAPA
jgi:signal transduction histidine kinase